MKLGFITPSAGENCRCEECSISDEVTTPKQEAEIGHSTVAIVLLNWNSRADTLECLESVFRLDYPAFRVILCDNASIDGSLEAVQDWADGRIVVAPASAAHAGLFVRSRPATVSWRRRSWDEAKHADSEKAPPELTLIDVGANVGFAGGNNVGIRYGLKCLRPDFFWLLNTDTIVAPDALTALVERAARDRKVGTVGSSLIYYWKPDTVQAFGGARLDRKTTLMSHIGDHRPISSIPHDEREVEAEMAYVIGASMLVSRPFVEQVGLMCEDYFLYYEEIDWALRGKEQFTLAYAPGSRVFHKIGGASRRVASTTSMRYLWRNRVRFVSRFMPEMLPGTLLNMTEHMIRALLKGRFDLSWVIARALLDFRRLAAEGRDRHLGERS